MNKPNPIGASVQPLAGRRLPAAWKPQITAGAFDQRPLEELWKSPKWSAKLNAENVQRDARLSRHPSWGELLGER